ncbi:pyridoxal phosphate-dependent transferase [Penicillium malachiteum]|uniref:Pyridoxal phosphate-dependent transferase n=1 Tax=Penicillium malachiteum TaxID=1324776 RepID=A0AAD6HVN4_9EURO|nr:pyridoxal phosphate-dependent transferase [Penicillium malachiteum]
MKADALLERVLLDRSYCHDPRKKYTIILVVNIGSTFIGGRDDILALRRALRSIGSDTSYILADGALDLGFSSELVQLGPAEMLLGKRGAPVVQAVTLSHHKVFGIMVSGQVVCHLRDTTKRTLATMASSGDPRAVFETWLVQQLYPAEDLARIHIYCLGNAQLLRGLLHDAGVDVRFNEESPITVFERVPSWLMYEFHLAPEGDWVHFIMMPHITSKAVHRFVQSIICSVHELGLEGSGVVTGIASDVKDIKVGDRVAFGEAGSLRSKVVIPRKRCNKIPDEYSMVDGAGILVVYSTALFSLIRVASLREGQSVLIHSACGGVGLAAIQICRQIGAVIYAAVGSEEKAEYLVKHWGIPRNHIFSSRNPSFLPGIKDQTAGRGADVVLNSLSGDLIRASWMCVAELE